MQAPLLNKSLIEFTKPAFQDLETLLTQIHALTDWLARKRCQNGHMLAEAVSDEIKSRIRIEDLGDGLTITYCRHRETRSKRAQARPADPDMVPEPPVPLDLLHQARSPRTEGLQRVAATDPARVLHAMLRAYVQFAALEGLRRDSRREMIQERISHEPGRAPRNPLDLAADSESHDRLHDAINSLSEPMGEVIRLGMEGMTQDQIAARLNISRSALYRIRVAALHRIRDSIVLA